MDNAIPTMIIGAILLTAIAVVGRGSLQTYADVGMSFRAMESRVSEKSGTRLTVTNTSVDPSGQFVTVELLNDGSTRIGSIPDLDVIVNYFTDPTGQASVWLPFDATGLTDNTWSLVAILSDDQEPGIFNPGETAQLLLRLNPAVATGPANSLIISTQVGAITFASFTRTL